LVNYRKTILFLAPEDPNKRFLDFVDDQGIIFHRKLYIIVDLGITVTGTNA
jgi:hypothetical protein